MSESFEYTRSWLNEEDFPLLGFTRNWENPSDYPTYEPDEAQVRKDMQSLHDEVKNYLNETLIPRVVAADATEQDRYEAEEARRAAELERAAAELERAAAELKRIGAERERDFAEDLRRLNELDRATSEADRVTKEEARQIAETQRAQAETVRQDLETGYVARAEAAAARAEKAADDAESTVGGDFVTRPELEEAIGKIPTPDVSKQIGDHNSDTEAHSEIRQAVSNAQTTADNAATAANNANASTATKALFGLGASAVNDDVFAWLGNYAATAPKIATGSYVGTGAYKVENPCVLTLGFKAKAVFIVMEGADINSGFDAENFMSYIDGQTYDKVSSGNTDRRNYAVDETTFSWYSTYSNKSQLNVADKNYYYFAIG